MRHFGFAVRVVVIVGGLVGQGMAAPSELPDGTEAATRRLAAFKVPDGLKVELFAAEPKLASPVAIGLDERNRVYVAEEYRFNQGTEENRTRPFLLDDDLQIQTLDDRLKMYEKFASKFEGGMDWFRKVADQVRLLEDTDGDGKADRSTVFAPGFNGTLDGLAAGVMARDGDVYFTCIPNLWRLRDTNGDGVADERTIVHTGFGVNAGFLGHDLHGLCWGPDGKLYFSIGDRGFHITTNEGKILHGPRNGAVFRCYPDGSELEVVCRGLRNPQELAFDQFGNLFAADNNCDKGDHSRLVYCLEGSDSGWNMSFQSIPDPYLTGPWHAEKMWHLWNGSVDAGITEHQPDDSATSPDRPAWCLPAVGKLGAGPSGFTYYPGTGLSPRYDHHFFMCNYTGNGDIDAFTVRPRGAGFETTDEHQFLTPISATDCEFGYDGRLYVSDFVNLIWNGGSSGGRIYTIFDPKHIQDHAVKQTADLVREGFPKLDFKVLVELLAHADLRVRQRAQFELASRGEESLPLFQAALASSGPRLARLHALWGLGQLAGARSHRQVNPAELRTNAVTAIASVIHDEDDEIRAWSVRLIGEHAGVVSDVHKPQVASVLKLLSDKSPRVRLFTAMAISRLEFPSAPLELLELIRLNNDADPWLRHACVMAAARLSQSTTTSQLSPLLSDQSAAVRLVGVLALRHLHLQQHDWSYNLNQDVSTTSATNAGMQHALLDQNINIVTEAARAISDLPLEASFPHLAAMTPTLKAASAAKAPEPLARRIINVNFRLGGLEQARRVLSLVVEPGLSLTIRREALAALHDWDQPAPRDRVTGFWRPVPARDPQAMAHVKSYLADNVATLLGGAGNELQADVVKLIARYQLPTDDTVFAGWVNDSSRNTATQTAALRLLTFRKSPLAMQAIEVALKADRPLVRAEARDLLAILKPVESFTVLEEALNSDSAAIVERQRALLALATLKRNFADKLLLSWMNKLAGDQVPESLQLDLLEAATLRDLPELKQAADQFRARQVAGDLLARHRISLNGGDSERGREIVLGHRVGQCVRCHKVGNELTGGTAGPDLHNVALRHDRMSLLQSLVDPSARIAKGFETVTLVMNDGKIYGGLIRSEEMGEIVLEQPNGVRVTLKTADVDERSAPKSAMPEMNRALSPRELRDVVEFLANLK